VDGRRLAKAEGGGCASASLIRIRSAWPMREEAAAYELDGYMRLFEALPPGAKAERVG
jgi:hypothetical protein